MLTKKNCSLFILICLSFFAYSCLTVAGSEIYKKSSEPEKYLSENCLYYSTNKIDKDRKDTPEEINKKENDFYLKAVTLIYTPMLLDTFIIYLIALQNGLAAVVYYGMGHIYLAINMHPPNPTLLKSWCGPPQNPKSEPAEYLYFEYSVNNENSCELNNNTKMQFLRTVFSFHEIKFNELEHSDLINKIKHYDIYKTKYRNYCKYYFKFSGGETEFIKYNLH